MCHLRSHITTRSHHYGNGNTFLRVYCRKCTVGRRSAIGNVHSELFDNQLRHCWTNLSAHQALMCCTLISLFHLGWWRAMQYALIVRLIAIEPSTPSRTATVVLVWWSKIHWAFSSTCINCIYHFTNSSMHSRTLHTPISAWLESRRRLSIVGLGHTDRGSTLDHR